MPVIVLINTINAELCNQSFQNLKTSVLHTLLAKRLCYTRYLSEMGSVYNTWNEPQEEVITVI